MECVTITADLKKGKNTIYINVLNDAVLTLDFVDVSKIPEYYGVLNTYFSPIKSRNAHKNENAWSVYAPYDCYYFLRLSETTDSIVINGISGKTSSISEYYLHRGYNKIVLDDNVVLKEVYLVDNAITHSIISPADMQVFNGATLEDDENTSSGKRIGWIASDKGSYATFNVNVKEAGYYNFTIEYANNEEGGFHAYNVDLIERYITVSINGENQGNYFFRSTYSWETYKTKTIVLHLDEGDNEIKLANDGSYSFNNRVTYAPNIGDIQVNPF